MVTKMEFEGLLSQLTMSDLNKIYSQLYQESGYAPTWETGASKAKQIGHFTYWVRGDPERVARTMGLVRDKLQEIKMVPKGLAEGTRYITKEEIQSLPGYLELIGAIEFPSKPGRCDPFTRDGKYLSVAAIYNMSAWASWKSSSLSDYERSKADAIHNLKLGDLMTLNKGRRTDQPALFPASGLLR